MTLTHQECELSKDNAHLNSMISFLALIKTHQNQNYALQLNKNFLNVEDQASKKLTLIQTMNIDMMLYLKFNFVTSLTAFEAKL